MKNYYLGLVIGSIITIEGILLEDTSQWLLAVTITAIIGSSIGFLLREK